MKTVRYQRLGTPSVMAARRKKTNIGHVKPLTPVCGSSLGAMHTRVKLG